MTVYTSGYSCVVACVLGWWVPANI